MRADEARRQLAAELRRLRGLAGMSGRDLAHRVGISQSTVSRIESGRLLPPMPVVTAWVEQADATEEIGQRLRTLTEAAHTEVTRFSTALRERPHLQDDIRRLEAAARVVRVFQPSVLPGLLQTAEYARRVFSLFQLPYSEQDLVSAVAARMDRQLALYGTEQRFEFLVTEAALRWRPGPPSLLAAQLSRVLSVATLANVSFGVIPQDAEARTFLSHGFVIYEPGEEADDAPVVAVETVHANITVHAPEDVTLYRDRWSLLRQMAIFDQDAECFVDDLAAEIQTAGR
ncbi:helix-turn-helix domain-containing protein [Amycolatopsis suaedae]|uniref:XRE family transcriptional regulator n=1 Tax=Amycolatopsis suaedae TaxID=2510978 RepID=A0A4Q7JDE4_9PSEU|nr:helix-turn-helix transcriptional regulator [Amycolatopsis suaedae]RZQ64394.1 XRE family transcriptional regulator [Amycolatopsis suaedae]